LEAGDCRPFVARGTSLPRPHGVTNRLTRSNRMCLAGWLQQWPWEREREGGRQRQSCPRCGCSLPPGTRRLVMRGIRKVSAMQQQPSCKLTNHAGNRRSTSSPLPGSVEKGDPGERFERPGGLWRRDRYSSSRALYSVIPACTCVSCADVGTPERGMIRPALRIGCSCI